MELAAGEPSAIGEAPAGADKTRAYGVDGKYFLRSLHEEIDLYDRKFAYLDKYVVFALPANREEAEVSVAANLFVTR